MAHSKKVAKAATITLLVAVALRPAFGADTPDPVGSPTDTQTEPLPPKATEAQSGLDIPGTSWSDQVARARASQPDWSSPMVTTTGLLEQRARFDLAEQHSGNGTDTTVIDGGRGLDLIVSDTNEIQLGVAPYDIRSGTPAVGRKERSIKPVSGFGDWALVRVKQRLGSSPGAEDNYVITAWLQVQAPTGAAPLTNDSWTFLPTIALGKGWGPLDIQATVGTVLPASHTGTIGRQIQTNLALQYQLLGVFWPEIEVNSTYYVDGQRGGFNQVYLTPGLVVGRFPISDRLKFTFGVGYQIAIAPDYRATPLTPAYRNAWLLTSRFSF